MLGKLILKYLLVFKRNVLCSVANVAIKVQT